MRDLVPFVGGPWDGRWEALVSLPPRLMVPNIEGKVRIWRRDVTTASRPTSYVLRRTCHGVPYYSTEAF